MKPSGLEAVAQAREILGSREDVLELLADGRSVFAEVVQGDRMVPPILAALERRGLTVSHISLSRPSLDDVYLHATGHAYHQEGRRAPEGRS